MTATHDDAMLMVELSKWGSMAGLDEAAREIMSDDFDPESANASDPNVSKMLMFGETIGTLVKHGLLDRELVYDWLWSKARGRGLAQRPNVTARSTECRSCSRTSRLLPRASD
jgi:hypothetical protein